MGRDSLEFINDWDAWKFLRSRGYEMHKGRIKYRPDKLNNMPKDEADALDYLCYEWDWSYE